MEMARFARGGRASVDNTLYPIHYSSSVPVDGGPTFRSTGHRVLHPNKVVLDILWFGFDDFGDFSTCKLSGRLFGSTIFPSITVRLGRCLVPRVTGLLTKIGLPQFWEPLSFVTVQPEVTAFSGPNPHLLTEPVD